MSTHGNLIWINGASAETYYKPGVNQSPEEVEAEEHRAMMKELAIERLKMRAKGTLHK